MAGERLVAICLFFASLQQNVFGWTTILFRRKKGPVSLRALSSDYLENDLVAVQRDETKPPRLCAVKPDGSVAPLCQREDDVETDLFFDPREFSDSFWEDGITDENVSGTYGEGYYGQRPVPSLGGGPGYGAQADEIWSLDEDTIDKIRADGVELPVLDVGIAHGEKARGGSY